MLPGIGRIGRIGAPGKGVAEWLSAVKNGTDAATSARLFWVGDSTSVGSKSGESGDSNTNAHRNSPPRVVAALATAEGWNARADGWANGSYGYATVADVEAYRPEMDLGTWTFDGRSGFSPRTLLDNNVGQGSITLTPLGAFDALEVWNILEAVTSSSQFTAAVDGVTEATISGSTSGTAPGLGGSPRQYQTVITGLTKKTQAIALTRVAGVIRPSALIPYNSDTSELIIVSVASSGMTTAMAAELNVSGTPKAYTMGNSGTYFPRDWTVINLGINDMLDAVALATFEANLDLLEANHGAASEILWVVPHYIDPNQVATATQETYHAAIIAHAAAEGHRVCDLRQAFGSYSAMVSAGDISSDGIHLLKQGSAKAGAAIWAALKRG